MYSTRTAPRSSLHTIENIPFATIATVFSELNRKSYIRFQEASDYARNKAELDFVKKWNETHEESFEGDFEEEVGWVGPKYRGLGSEEEAELKVFLDEFALKYKFTVNAEWIFGQMLAKLSSLPLVRNTNNKISAKALVEEIRQSPFLTGMWVVCNYPTRSTWIKGQTDEKYRNFSALVPLIMSAFKKYKDIPYSDWERTEIHHITEKHLANVMRMDKLPDLTKDEVIEARTAGLTVKSGVKMGEVRSPKSTFTLYIPAGMGFDDLDMLAKIMICQTWCAHPSIRTEYMILNPLDWDNMPEPLVSSTVLLKNAVASSNFYPPGESLGAKTVPWME